MTTGVVLIAHPDDEVIFAHNYRLLHRWIDWTVICLTYTQQELRAQESIAYSKHFFPKNPAPKFLGLADDPSDWKIRTCSWKTSRVEMKLWSLKSVDVVVTHGKEGEYGHPHHREANRLSKFINAKTRVEFSFGTQPWSMKLSTGPKAALFKEFFPSQAPGLAFLDLGEEKFWIY